MNLLIYSDIHNEFNLFTPPPEAIAAADVVVLAGDIHERLHAINWAQTTFPDKPVILVAGNHEYYGGKFFSTLEKMRAAAEGTNVHLLEQGRVVIDGVRFLGCTLWTDMKLYGPPDAWMGRIVEQYMPDYHKVRNDFDGYRKLLVKDTVLRHRAHVEWLRDELATPFTGRTVVVTHHAPTVHSIPKRFAGETISRAFASNLDELVAPPVDLWIHGHIHDTLDYRHPDTGVRIVCNPRGYLPEEPNRGFQAKSLWVV